MPIVRVDKEKNTLISQLNYRPGNKYFITQPALFPRYRLKYVVCAWYSNIPILLIDYLHLDSRNTFYREHRAWFPLLFIIFHIQNFFYRASSPDMSHWFSSHSSSLGAPVIILFLLFYFIFYYQARPFPLLDIKSHECERVGHGVLYMRADAFNARSARELRLWRHICVTVGVLAYWGSGGPRLAKDRALFFHYLSISFYRVHFWRRKPGMISSMSCSEFLALPQYAPYNDTWAAHLATSTSHR